MIHLRTGNKHTKILGGVTDDVSSIIIIIIESLRSRWILYVRRDTDNSITSDTEYPADPEDETEAPDSVNEHLVSLQIEGLINSTRQ